MSFYVGQKVVAVGVPDVDPHGIPCPLVNGRIYTIIALLEQPDNPIPDLRYGLALAEVLAPPPYRGFVRYFFRPAVERKTDISIFQKMLTDERVTV